jgi:hypothetical protein
LLFACEKKEKPSQYKGVYFHKQSGKWRVQLKLKRQQKCGGYFDHELDAGKRMNQLCEEFGIPLRNPELSAVPNEQHEVPKNMFCHTALREKCEL